MSNQQILYDGVYVKEKVNEKLNIMIRLTNEKEIEPEIKILLKGYLCEYAYIICNDFK